MQVRSAGLSSGDANAAHKSVSVIFQRTKTASSFPNPLLSLMSPVQDLSYLTPHGVLAFL